MPGALLQRIIAKLRNAGKQPSVSSQGKSIFPKSDPVRPTIIHKETVIVLERGDRLSSGISTPPPPHTNLNCVGTRVTASAIIEDPATLPRVR